MLTICYSDRFDEGFTKNDYIFKCDLLTNIKKIKMMIISKERIDNL